MRAQSTPAEEIKKILERCHGPLLGTMENCFLELRKKAGEERPVSFILGSEEKMRITRRDRTKEILLGNRGWSVPPPGKVKELSGKELARLKRMYGLMRAILLQPLYKAEKVTKAGAGVYQLVLAEGETWRLETTRVGKLLLPGLLQGPPGTVAFKKYRDTGGVTHLPLEIELAEFGSRHFTLLSSDLVLHPVVFQDPTAPVDLEAKKERLGKFSPAQELPYGKPQLQQIAASISLIVEDPGDWKARFELMNKHGWTLYNQGQIGADLNWFYTEKKKRYMAIPFEMNTEEPKKGRPFVRKPDQTILRRETHVAAVVYPTRGSEKECTVRAKTALREFLSAQKLKASGPMRMVPYVEPEKGIPSAEDLENLKIRFEIPVRGK